MPHRDWRAAGITDPDLRQSYESCRRLHARHGRTFYLATLLLPAWKRPYVDALYGFARYADDIVDTQAPDVAAAEFARFRGKVLADFEAGSSDDDVCRALMHTADTWHIPYGYFTAFLDSMASDLHPREFPTYADLRNYMYGSAAVIGLQMGVLLEPLDDAALPRLRALGEASQLANFLRDLGEDLARGHLYLPMEDLAAFGVTRADLEAGRRSTAMRDLLAFEVARTRRLYAYARGCIPLLHPSSRECVRTAATLYAGILDVIEDSGYRVFDRRARVSARRRLAVAVPAYVRARRSWRGAQHRLPAGLAHVFEK